MKTNSHNDENQNLVMFPSSKNFKIDLSATDLGADPLHDLITEYSSMSDLEIPSHLDDRFELEFEDELDGDTFHSLEAFMNRGSLNVAQTPDDKLVALINERIEAIKDAKERIKFYLDEIEMFLPARRK